MLTIHAALIVAAAQFAFEHGIPTSRRFRAAHRLAHRTLDVRGW